MGSIIAGYLLPHPPIIIPEVGKGREVESSVTIAGMEAAAESISKDKPSVIILITPHLVFLQDFIFINNSEVLKGNLSRFDAAKVKSEFLNNLTIAKAIAEKASNAGILSGSLEDGQRRKFSIQGDLDHGAMVPLYFIEKFYTNFKLVHIAVADLEREELYKFGECIAEAIKENNETAVIIASGDLSHRLSKDAPYGYNRNGAAFDSMLLEGLKKGDPEAIINIDADLAEDAGECGLRPVIMMLGSLDGYDLEPQVYSYEGPFGVGYATVRLGIGKKKANGKDAHSSYVNLAIKSLGTFVKTGKIIKAESANNEAMIPDDLLNGQAGVFVSLKKGGRLRGCIGTTAPTRKNIAEEIIYNAISAGTKDPRFSSVRADELSSLVYSVDVLGKPEPINSFKELDVKKYGVIVRCGYRSGLLLPDLEGVDTVEEQVSIALNKAGIRENEKYSMERFEVIRYK